MVTVYLAGDSTVQTYSEAEAPQGGWGQFIDRYATDDVRFDNRAIGGRSSKTFIEEGRLDAIWADIRPYDYIWVQMGHNDATTSRPDRYTEPYKQYKSYLKQYVEGARSRQAVPLLITPVGRLHLGEDGRFMNDFPDYCEAMKQVGAETRTTVVDLMSASLKYYEEIGFEEAQTLFMVSVNGTDLTHFTRKGADAIARLLAQLIKRQVAALSRFF
ncbi:rhamnogalacturonan acetylesterase [Paenibacillus sp.]|uniref:rhamnogalacturonan acetylesterase n=1 Tax=Paenibacillus sp. TaxID=58172 RepID=UPI002D50F165|nr:rhamnogalacturonan acetylesterase [Paenibacillus sp.]HZG87820.1 rhamnogalacturonan acetylesterase [Paenibacillus sp.]